MLDSLRGTVLEARPEAAVVETGGFALRIRLPAGATAGLVPGQEVRFYCYLLFRDEQFLLYGFTSQGQRDLFATLLGVSGLGPEKARAILGAMSPADVVRAVERAESRRFQAVKGIGTRLAERLVVDLKGKLEEFAALDRANSTQPASGSGADVMAALLQLGFPRSQVEPAADAALQADPAGTTEALVKSALRILQKPR